MKSNIETPFGLIDFVGVLAEHYTTIVFKNEENYPVVVEWLDIINGEDFFIIFNTTAENINKYCDRSISHLDLIKSGEKYFEYGGEMNNFKEIIYDNIDKKSLPRDNVYFENDFEDYEVFKDFR